ncbi:MAG: ribosome hibernation-promoting factor, HPF/YfiA family [Phycisphaerae bacterium]
MMRITVSGRHMDLSDRLKSFVDEKVGKLERFYDRAHSAEVVFERQGDNHRCEIIVKADHHMTFIAKEEHEDPYAAADATLKDLERQLNRHKEKFRNRKHPDGLGDREPLGEPPTGESPATSTEG